MGGGLLSEENFVNLYCQLLNEFMNFRIFQADRSIIRAFLRQNFFLLISLFFLAFGVAMCVRSDLGSSVISSAPYAFYLAGEKGMAQEWSLGMYTNLLNIMLVASQIVVLRKRYRPFQLLQLLIGVVFGVLIDISMIITEVFISSELYVRLPVMLIGATLMAIGVAMEIRCASITMPGEGLPAALSKVTGRSFANMKILTDISLVALAVISSLWFFGSWQWNIVGFGTLFAMIYIGLAVKIVSRHLSWFDRLVSNA